MQLASHWPVPAIAGCAKSMASIGVQLVENVLHLIDGTFWPARGARWPDHCVSAAVPRAGSHSGPRPALIGRHRDRRGFGAGHPARLGSPGRGAEQDRGHRAKTTMASGMFGAIRFFMARLLSYELRSLQSCLACWAGLPGTYDVMNSGCRRRPGGR